MTGTPAPPTLPTSTASSASLCSDADAALDDDPRGSAAAFSTFLLIEHVAGFGREAADDAVRAVYGAAADAVNRIPGLRPFAIRPVGRAAGVVGSAVRWLGRTGSEGALQPVSGVPTPAELAAAGSIRGAVEPLFAVCTNGARDRCCAIKGRDLAATLHAALDDPDDDATVVEISHVGGHRYAPTMMVLPWGYAYARLDRATALDIAEAARDGLVHPAGLRGRADLPPAAQVAEALWRADLGPAAIDAVAGITSRSAGDVETVTAQVAGRTETLRLAYVEGPAIGASACGGKPFATGRWQLR